MRVKFKVIVQTLKKKNRLNDVVSREITSDVAQALVLFATSKLLCQMFFDAYHWRVFFNWGATGEHEMTQTYEIKNNTACRKV